jgi:hypothetical protein
MRLSDGLFPLISGKAMLPSEQRRLTARPDLYRSASQRRGARARDGLARVRACTLVGARDRAFGAPRHCGTPRRGRIVCKQAPSRGGRTLATRRFTGATHARGLSVGARDRAFGAPRPCSASRRGHIVAQSGSVAVRAHSRAALLSDARHARGMD